MIQEKKTILQKLFYHLIAVCCFIAVTLIYFSPLLDGKVLPQGDVQQYKGMSRELSQYYNNEGESSAWTGSMFSGMPAYQIGVWSDTPHFLDYIEAPVKAFGNNTAGPVLAGMLMAYILFCMMGVGFVPAILGAIAYSLSSYNIIIIEAGHVTKAWAIAYMPLIIASFVALFKKKYLIGGLLMAVGLALQIKNNHLQMTYYTGLLCVFIYISLLIHNITNKDVKGLLKSTGVLAIGVVIAVLCNLGNIYSNYEMSKESIRGQSELTKPATSDSEKQSSGLDKDYAFAWSYGKAETLSLLIPDIHGGASGGLLSPNSHLYQAIKANAPGAQLEPRGIQAQTYWGDQPGTSGPVYFGAIICMLFILGMFVIKNPIKWSLFIATLFFIALAWGRNYEGFNDWMFYHFPLYNKFRAVSSALVIPALTVVVIAIWGLKDFFTRIDEKERLKKYLYISTAITAGLCLLVWMSPGLFQLDFMSKYDSQWASQVPDWYYTALLADRRELLSADAIRSLIFIVLASAVLFLCLRANNKKAVTTYSSIALVLLVMIDLWGVDKRYLNNDNFETKLNYNVNQPFPQTQADKIILQDNSPSYRVLNLNNPFNETKTSYYHKSIGGYHAAKLKRYQELIEYNLQHEINSIIGTFESQNIDSITNALQYNNALNMLNAKYIIFNPDQAPIVNPYAMGNAWFVSDYKLVDNADQEIGAIENTDLHTTAIVDKRYANDLTGLTITPDSTASIKLITYKPNILRYETSTQGEQLAVFSEVFYANGWEAYIDGKQAPYFCADWTLRAMRIPAGSHTIEFKFIPHGYNSAIMVSSISSGLLVLLCLVAIGISLYRKEPQN